MFSFTGTIRVSGRGCASNVAVELSAVLRARMAKESKERHKSSQLQTAKDNKRREEDGIVTPVYTRMSKDEKIIGWSGGPWNRKGLPRKTNEWPGKMAPGCSRKTTYLEMTKAQAEHKQKESKGLLHKIQNPINTMRSLMRT